MQKFSQILVFVVGVIVVGGLLTSMVALSGVQAAQEGPPEPGDAVCITIQDQVLTYSPGHYLDGMLLQTGFDSYGYNYQAHLFQGSYANAYLGGAGYPPYLGDDESYLAANPSAESHWTWPYRDVMLSMKWNDMWLSNKDCDNNGLLDRHFGFSSYIGSGAWLTNHMEGGEKRDIWTYFVKVVAAPQDAILSGGTWETFDGQEIGPVIWGDFAVMQEIDNELKTRYISPSGPGLGKF